MKPKLYIVSTPIGNYEDITLRALRILKECDFIICEEFKEARRLLANYKIQKELFSLNEHTENEAANDLILKLLEGNLKNVKLYLIGVVEDADVFEELINHILVKSGHMIILTESLFTNEASKMLYLADAVIGTGRGLMEAASLGKPLLAINKNGEIPILLNEMNFNDAFKTNFSERNVFPKLNDDENIKSIAQIIYDKESYLANSFFVTQSFEKYFSLEKAKEEYSVAYKQSKTSKRKLFADLPFILRSILNFYLSYKKLTK